MKMVVTALLIVLMTNFVKADSSGGVCDFRRTVEPRPHTVSILEFGAKGDGKTVNTIAFQNAIFYLKSFQDKGGAQLYFPPGRWLTGSLNLTSHLTIFLDKGAVILGTQNLSNWDLVEPLPSYGRGREVPGRRYRSLLNGYMLEDVVITGDGGTINGQGSVWWDLYSSQSLNHSRPHLIELSYSKDIVISNVTLLGAPSFNLRPVYCSNVYVHNVTVYAPPESHTVGIVLDSSERICIRNCTISTGHDAISLKSGWDEYGISFGIPTTTVHIKQVDLRSSFGSALSFGSEMSGGIADVLAEHLYIHHSCTGVHFRTAKGRGGYIQNIIVSKVEIRNVRTAFGATGQSGAHPDEDYDPRALPELSRITLKDVVGSGISLAGNFSGIKESPFTSICLSNISLSVVNNSTASTYWECSNVSGSSRFVFPEPCKDLDNSSPVLSSTCFSLLNSDGRASAL